MSPSFTPNLPKSFGSMWRWRFAHITFSFIIAF
jgi:hypothetical protein